MTYLCPSCGQSLEGALISFEARRQLLLHKQAHARVERRRAQWRESARRKRALAKDPDVVGYLHNLGCSGQHRGNNKCRPIPCYSHPVTP